VAGAIDPDASVIVFGPGITSYDIHYDGGALVVDLGEGDALRFTQFDPNAPNSTPVFDRLEFDDGSVFTYEDLAAQSFTATHTAGDDLIIGTDHADILDGGKGNDTLVGGAGKDTYVFDDVGDGSHVGDGIDTIIDPPTGAG